MTTTDNSTAAAMVMPPGVTYRQVQGWVARGYIFDDDDQVHPGSGNYRKWTPEAQQQLDYLALFRQAGFETSAAACLAARVIRQLAEMELAEIELELPGLEASSGSLGLSVILRR